MEIQGTIKMIGATKKVSEKFTKRDLRITTDGDYPQVIEVQFTQDKCAILDKFKVGEQVSISINIRGREWPNPKDGELKCFNTIEGWKIDYAGKHANDIQGAAEMINRKISEDDLGDLPFYL